MITWAKQQQNDVDWYKADINKNIALHLNCDYFSWMYENYCQAIHGKTFQNSLDIGISNTGGFTSIIPDIRKRFGLDPAVDLLKEMDMLPLSYHIHYIKGLAENMPFEKDTFDLIIITNALDHVQDMVQSMKELERVTQSGGYVLFATYLRVKKPHPWTFNSEEEARGMFKDFELIDEHTVIDKRPFFQRNDSYIAIFKKP
jgi:SAM-dependent methyltransferase